MRTTLILTCILVFSFPAFSQNGILTGRITTPDGEPAGHISISLDGTSLSTLTDEAGAFVLKASPGSYRLAVHRVGLDTRTIPVHIYLNDTTVAPDIPVTAATQRLGEVVVQGQRHGYKTNKVSTSLRLLTPLKNIPQNIQVITAKALNDQQVLSLSDGVIRDVSGATRLEHWDMYTRINMRGSRASEFRNGMNVTSSWGPLSADMSIVDRIEFVKGPAGFMMSNGDPAGIFNIVTRKPSGADNSGAASVMYGSFDLYRATFDLDGHLDSSKKVLYRLDLMDQTRNSFQKYRFDNRYTIHPVITYRLDDKTQLTAEYTLQHAQMSNVGLPYAFSVKGYCDLPRNFASLGPQAAPTTVNDHSVFLYLEHRFNADWKLSVHTAWLHALQAGSSIWPSSLDSAGNMIRTISMFDALNNYRFGQAYINGSFRTGKLRHRILAGLDLGDKENTYDWGQSHSLDDAAHPFNIYHPVYGSPFNGFPAFDRSKKLRQRPEASFVNQSYRGLYLQDELAFLQGMVRLTVAGRYTYVFQSDYGTDYHAAKVTPRFGLSVSIDAHTSAYALFDQSFLPQSGLLRGDRTPKPLTGNNLEVGVKRDWFGGRWSSTLSLYRILENGKLTTDPDTTGNPDHRYALQIGQNRTRGVELDIRGEIVRGLNVVLNYAFTDARISKDIDKSNVGRPVPGFARHVANGWLTYRIKNGDLKGLGVSGGFSLQKDRSTWGWGSAGQMDLPDYFRMDGGLFWKSGKMKVNLTVNNLLNSYLYSGAPYGNYYYWQMEPPRNFKISVAYLF